VNYSGGEYSTADYSSEAISIFDVNERFPIECLRSKLYSVYKVREGGYFYVFWIGSYDLPQDMLINNPNDLIVYFATYIPSLKKVSDFDGIKEGISTADDVSKIDPSFEISLAMSRTICSYSLLQDGKIMEIEYKNTSDTVFNRKTKLVTKKHICKKEESKGRLSTIFSGDLP